MSVFELLGLKVLKSLVRPNMRLHKNTLQMIEKYNKLLIPKTNLTYHWMLVNNLNPYEPEQEAESSSMLLKRNLLENRIIMDQLAANYPV